MQSECLFFTNIYLSTHPISGNRLQNLYVVYSYFFFYYVCEWNTSRESSVYM